MPDNQFVNKRIDGIYEYLKKHRRASIEDLAKALYMSQSTIRRDLAEMQQLGMIARYHGGAMLRDGADELSIFTRLEKDTEHKQRVAEIAIRHIPEFSSVFIDNSTTCLALTQKLDLAGKLVVTNGLQLALQLSRRKDVQLVIPGGSVHFNTNALTGSMATRMMRTFTPDLMLFSCAALSEKGIFERSLETTQLKQVVTEQCRCRILIADESKLGASAAFRIARPEDMDAIITDAPDERISALKATGAHLLNI